jgi:hypothetical protein
MCHLAAPTYHYDPKHAQGRPLMLGGGAISARIIHLLGLSYYTHTHKTIRTRDTKHGRLNARSKMADHRSESGVEGRSEAVRGEAKRSEAKQRRAQRRRAQRRRAQRRRAVRNRVERGRVESSRDHLPMRYSASAHACIHERLRATPVGRAPT